MTAIARAPSDLLLTCPKCRGVVTVPTDFDAGEFIDKLNANDPVAHKGLGLMLTRLADLCQYVETCRHEGRPTP